jgi:hypothetical protein
MMINKHLLFNLSAALLIGFSSCSKEDNNGNNGGGEGPSTNSSFTASVDGAAFSADTAITGFITGTDDFVIQAVDGIQSMGFYLAEFTGEGTYSLSQAVSDNGFYYPDTSNTEDVYMTFSENGIGSITVSDLNLNDSLVSGSFSFTGQNQSGESVDITQGTFQNIRVTEQAVSGIVNNTFSVDINDDGVITSWEANGGMVSATPNFGSLNIFAIDNANNSAVQILLPEEVAPGTYSLDLGGSYYALYTIGFVTYISVSGSVTISEHEVGSKISGIFSFEGETGGGDDTLSFTNGSFEIEY